MTLTADRVSPHSKSDEHAWLEQALQQHWNRVHAVVFRLVGDADEAEDLALEAFWQLHQSRPSLVDDSSLRGWLYRVATNLGLNALRARRRRQQYESAAGEQPSSADTAQEAERLIERLRTRQALAQLKPRSAQILLLRHSGLSYAEIAAALQIAPASVGTLLARAEREFEQQYRRLEMGG